MKFISEERYHALFRWSVALKALMSVLEVVLGVALYFISYVALKHTAVFLTGDEFAETPRDFLWSSVVKSSHDFTAVSESFWAFLFISHGLVKAFLSWGLWKEKLWAFPTAAIVFVGFIVYQLYQLTYLTSIFLWLVTAFDVALVALIVHEYWRRRGRI